MPIPSSSSRFLPRRLSKSLPPDYQDEVACQKRRRAVREEELEEHADGLICLTGGADGPLAAALQHGGIKKRASKSSD